MICPPPPPPPSPPGLYPTAIAADRVEMPHELAQWYAVRSAYARQLEACAEEGTARSIEQTTEIEALTAEAAQATTRAAAAERDLAVVDRTARAWRGLALVGIPAAVVGGVVLGARASR